MKKDICEKRDCRYEYLTKKWLARHNARLTINAGDESEQVILTGDMELTCYIDGEFVDRINAFCWRNLYSARRAYGFHPVKSL